MKKLLILLTILSSFSFSRNIKGDFKYNINVTKNYDYNVKATFNLDEKKWLYNPKYKYNKHNSTHQIANINGNLNSSLGIYLKYNLQSPIKLDEFHGEEDKKKNLSGKKYRSLLNPNLTQKPNFDFTLGYAKTFFINNDITINNDTNLKYILSTFKGLENVEEKQLDINEDFTVYNKYINVNTNFNYSSIKLINPIEYSLGFGLDKNIFDSNFKFKVKVNHKLEEDIVKNRIIDIVAHLDTTPHDHGGEKTPFFVQEKLEAHQRRSNFTNFGEDFKGIYIIPEFTLEYSKKLNKNLFLNTNNTFKYSILRYSGYAKDADKKYIAKSDVLENETKLNLRYSDKKLKNISELGLKYSRTLHNNNFTKNFNASGINFINFISEKKRNYQELNLSISDKVLYELNLSNKLSLTPRIYAKYQGIGKSFILSKEEKDEINAEIKKIDKEIDEYIKEMEKEEKEEDKKIYEEEIEVSNIAKKGYLDILKLQNFNFEHNLIIEPGLVLDYSINSKLSAYTSIDIPFIFKTRKEKKLGLKALKVEKEKFQKIPQENVFLPNNYNVKLNFGIKYSF